VQVSSYVTGFNAAGDITGEVYATTTCNGSGRGSRSTKYQSWNTVAWPLTGGYVIQPTYDGVVPDSTLTESDQWGNLIFDVCSTLCTANATIVYAPGPIVPPVPNVVGMTAAAAEALLTADQYTYTVITEITETTPTGTVLGQSVPAGTQGTAGLRVTLYVAQLQN
jgi:hypothetical protein